MPEELIQPLMSKFNLHYMYIQFAPHREQFPSTRKTNCWRLYRKI